MEIEENRIILRKEAACEARPFVVVGIPALNEERTIARVILEAQRYADHVIVCDDGSTDLTGEIADRLGADVVRHEQNLGYGAAIQSLFRRARELGASILITLDADGQHDPGEIPRVAKPIMEGAADIVVGSRFVDSHRSPHMPLYRRVGVKLLTMLTNGMNSQGVVKDAQSGFRAYNRRSLEKLTVFEDGMGISSEILIKARKQHLRIDEVHASCKYENGSNTSSCHPVRHGVGVVASIVKLVLEDRPLVTLGLPGLSLSVVGLFFGALMLQLYASEHQIVTNVALASIAFILIGLFFVFTAITLYAISITVQKNSKSIR